MKRLGPIDAHLMNRPDMTPEANQIADCIESALAGFRSLDDRAVAAAKAALVERWSDAKVWLEWERRGETLTPKVVKCLKVSATSTTEPRRINVICDLGDS